MESVSVPTQKSILLVDDHAEGQWPLSQALSALGYLVTTAESGEAALKLMESQKFQLLVTDIKMPGMNGLELVRLARQFLPGVAVVLTTAFGSLELRQEALRLGAASYLEKPLDLQQLLQIIVRLLDSPGFVGTVTELDLLDYLQLIGNTRKSKRVEVATAHKFGQLFFQGGQLIHAVTGDLEGARALHEIISWPTGTFQDLPFVAPGRRTLGENTAFLLMEAARMRDERTFLEDTLPISLHDASLVASLGQETSLTPTGRSQGPVTVGYRQLLEELGALPGVRGSLVFMRTGLTLARAGTVPNGSEAALRSVIQAVEALAVNLDLGRSETWTLELTSGEAVQVVSGEGVMVGIWLTEPQQAEALTATVRQRLAGLES